MSLLGELLAAKEPLFEYTLTQLEQRSGQAGIDATLTAELHQKVRDRSGRLGISADDSNQALYRALIGRIKQDDQRLCQELGGNDPTSLAQLVPLIVKRVEDQPMPKSGWFIKPAKAKQLLTKTPPKAIMKLLGYSSAKQLVAKENIFELFCALRFCESPSWLNKFDQSYANWLKPEDFETRDIKIVVFPQDPWELVAAPFVKKKLHNITHSKEIGAVCVLPAGDVHAAGVATKVLPLILHYFNEIRMYSAYFKLIKTRTDFGKKVAETLIADAPQIKLTETGSVQWRVIQRYFGKLPHEHHPEIFEPHVQPEDLHWRRAEEVLYQIDPEFEFWRDLDYVAAWKNDEAVSFNLMDVSLSYANQLSFKDRYLYHFRESLWNEIFARYFSDSALRQQVLTHLDNEVIQT